MGRVNLEKAGKLMGRIVMINPQSGVDLFLKAPFEIAILIEMANKVFTKNPLLVWQVYEALSKLSNH